MKNDLISEKGTCSGPIKKCQLSNDNELYVGNIV